jgi:trehalose 6-phosphate synthase/phosphatase
MSRVVIVSNRLPVTVERAEDRVRVVPSVGGLATGLRRPHEQGGGPWIGWPGDLGGLDPAALARVDARLADLRLVPVQLTPEEVQRYYQDCSNGLLWPVFHSFVGEVPLEMGGAAEYERVNARFADAIAATARPGDVIWVHDYQLLRLPALLRERLPDARIGFFLHIPFPSSDVFRVLPQRDALLEGMLGADLIGFHTASYMRHFSSSVLRVLGAWTDVDRIRWRGREVRIGVFPMGVDAADFAGVAHAAEVEEEVRALRQDGTRLLVGIDRLDYTKGIPRRLLAYERLLREHPELRGKVRLVQVAVPSRTEVGAYQQFREQVDGLVGRIHGAFATPTWSPIHYLSRGVSRPQVVALYRAADVMLVTPIRDGMNLVAKEFVAVRDDGDGVLVLSEFTGAAAELAEAVQVNPYDAEGTATAIFRALEMPEDERRTRMAGLRRRVTRYDVHWWARTFLDRLREAPAPVRPQGLEVSPPAAIQEALSRLRAAPHATLLLDYDGTLVPFAPTPELARPDRELRDLLRELARRPHLAVHIVTGRQREIVDRWFGDLGIGLHAEHGFWSRLPGTGWQLAAPVSTAWREPARAILEEFAARTPGSLVEEKSAGFAWHYRTADPDFGAAQAHDLMLHLSTVLSNAPVEILPGALVVEVRPQGVDKGKVVARAAVASPEDSVLAALGDDRTDEDMFAALPPGAIAVHVGPSPSRAALRLAGVPESRAFLRGLL